MVTLLFAVFVVLYAIQISKQKDLKGQVEKSIQRSFSGESGAISGDESGGVGDQNNPSHISGASAVIPRYPGGAGIKKIVADSMARIRTILPPRLLKSQTNEVGAKVEPKVVVFPSRDGLKIRLAAVHFFDNGKTELSPRAYTDLDLIAQAVISTGQTIVIEGHTDTAPSTGHLSNWEVSSMRAGSVLRYLVNKHNFPKTAAAIAGYGDSRPVDLGTTEAARQVNRRVEIFIQYDADPAD